MEGRLHSWPMPVGADGWRHLRAIRISAPIRELLTNGTRDGSVVSTHRAAVNLSLDGVLVTVAHPQLGGLPMGISLAGQATLDRLALRPRMRVEGRADRVSIGDARLAIDLAAAATWSPLLPALDVIPAADRADRMALSMRLARPLATAVGFGPLLGALAADAHTGDGLAARAAALLASVLDALSGGEMSVAALRARELIGLGPGATPSGDDLLVGLMAGLAATGHPGTKAFAGHVAAQAPGRTTQLGEAFLVHAGKLQFSERAQTAVVAMLAARPDRLESVIHETCRWGASSGTDLLTGLLIGIGADLPSTTAALRRISDHAAVAA